MHCACLWQQLHTAATNTRSAACSQACTPTSPSAFWLTGSQTVFATSIRWHIARTPRPGRALLGPRVHVCTKGDPGPCLQQGQQPGDEGEGGGRGKECCNPEEMPQTEYKVVPPHISMALAAARPTWHVPQHVGLMSHAGNKPGGQGVGQLPHTSHTPADESPEWLLAPGAPQSAWVPKLGLQLLNKYQMPVSSGSEAPNLLPYHCCHKLQPHQRQPPAGFYV